MKPDFSVSVRQNGRTGKPGAVFLYGNRKSLQGGKIMRRNIMKAAAAIIAAALVIGPTAGMTMRAEAASASNKSSVYVVKSIKKSSTASGKDANYSFGYNSNGFFSKQVIRNSRHTGNNYVSKYTYTYKPWKFEVGTVTKYGSNKQKAYTWTYAYQTANKVKDYYRRTPSGTYVDKLQFVKRDGSNRIIRALYTKWRSQSSAGGTLTLKYTYDRNGNLVKDTIVNSSGNVQKIRKFAYDSHGNVTKESDYNKNGKLTGTIRYANTYAKNGTLKKSVCTEKTKKGKTVKTTYTYSYKKLSVSSSYKKYVKQQQKDKIHTISYNKQVTDVQ